MWGESSRIMKIPLVINIINETSCALPLRQLLSPQHDAGRRSGVKMRHGPHGAGAAGVPRGGMDKSASLEVWYDGACPLCTREIALMRRLDWAGRIRFTDLAADGAACPIDRAALLARFHARENGVLLSGAAAFAAMWRAVPLLWPLGQAARVPFVLRALEWLYLRFLTLRPRLQAMLR